MIVIMVTCPEGGKREREEILFTQTLLQPRNELTHRLQQQCITRPKSVITQIGNLFDELGAKKFYNTLVCTFLRKLNFAWFKNLMNTQKLYILCYLCLINYVTYYYTHILFNCSQNMLRTTFSYYTYNKFALI